MMPCALEGSCRGATIGRACKVDSRARVARVRPLNCSYARADKAAAFGESLNVDPEARAKADEVRLSVRRVLHYRLLPTCRQHASHQIAHCLCTWQRATLAGSSGDVADKADPARTANSEGKGRQATRADTRPAASIGCTGMYIERTHPSCCRYVLVCVRVCHVCPGVPRNVIV